MLTQFLQRSLPQVLVLTELIYFSINRKSRLKKKVQIHLFTWIKWRKPNLQWHKQKGKRECQKSLEETSEVYSWKGLSGSEFTVKAHDYQNVTFLTGQLPGDSLNYVELACSSPFLEQLLAAVIWKEKEKKKNRNSYQDTKGKSQSTLKSLRVLPSKLIEPEFHALSHSINIKEIMSTDLPRRTSLSNSHITGISWTARQMFQEHMSIASQRRSQATACIEALR